MPTWRWGSTLTGQLALANSPAEEDEKWTTEQVFEVLAKAGFSGTLKDARGYLFKKRHRPGIAT
jgi:hypothetical protein